jgi:hypothetical protein
MVGGTGRWHPGSVARWREARGAPAPGTASDGPQGPAIGGGAPLPGLGLGDGDSGTATVGKDGEDVTVGRANSQCSIDGSGAPSVTISASLGRRRRGQRR